MFGTLALVAVAAVVAFFGLRGDGDSPTSTTSLNARPTSTTLGSATTVGATTATTVSPLPTPADTTNTSGATTTVDTTTDPLVPSTEPTSTTTTTLPAAEDPDAGEDAAAPVPLGEAIVHGNWQIGVSLVDLDAGELVAGMYEDNQPPDDGFRYVLVELSGTNVGDSHAEPVFDVGLVNGEFRHDFSFDECGQIIDALIDVRPQGPGEHMAANVCFNVPEDQVNEDLVLTLGFFDEQGRERFFALQD